MEIPGFEILNAQNSHDDLLEYWGKGALRGVYLGFPELHEYYTMSLPGVTDWTGFPQSGKSEILLELLLNTSLFYGWKHLLYVPDVGDKNEILAILIHKITGKTFDKRFNNHITEAEVSKEIDWVLHHFRILTKIDLKAKISPYEFWEMAAEMNKSEPGGIQTATIDSWKDMKHTTEFGRDDKYLEDVLSYRNAMSEKHKMHLHVIVHPTRTEMDNTGKRKPPTPYDIKGGTEWYNNGKVMISVHRPDGGKNFVDIMITKAKPKSVAKLGTAAMKFDTRLARFYYVKDGVDTYADKDYIPPVVPDALKIKQDDEDDLPF